MRASANLGEIRVTPGVTRHEKGMTSPTAGIPLQDLLENLSWVRGVARAVAGESEADDLAQDVWLRAAEHPPERSGPARAWLSRVLRNAHLQRRRTDARRREREAAAGAGMGTEASATPDEIVARAEAQRRVVNALFQLDEASREILILRYFQQWTPAQIASSLGQTPGAVRTRLSRALARLRRNLSQEHGRREAQLLVAGAAGLAQPASLAVPALVAAAGIGAIALGIAVWSGGSETLEAAAPGPDLALSQPAGAIATQAGSSSEAATSEPDSAPSRELAAASRAGSFTISGRCVQDGSGAGLAGVTLTAHPNSCRLARPDLCTDHARSETVTAADGSFDFSFNPPEEEFRIELAAEGWLHRHAYWNAIPTHPVEDFGEIRMFPAYAVSGRVENESGEAVEGVRVVARDLPLGLRPEPSYVKHLSATADAQGEFTFSLPLPAGSWTLQVERQGSVLLDPALLVLPPGGQSEPLIVRVRQMPSIRGVCLDEQGAPLAGVIVRGKLPADRVASLMATSGADGSFSIFARQERQLSESVTLEAKAQGRLDLLDPVERAWGDRAIPLTLRRAPEMLVEVVDAATGLPVTGFTLFVQHLPEDGTLFTPEKADGPHAAGRAAGVLQIGTSLVRIAPDAEEWAVPPAQLLQSDGHAPQNVRFELVPTGRLRVQLLAAGEPVPGALVESFLPGSRPLELTEHAILLRSAYSRPHPDFPLRASYKEGERTTDASGLAELATQPEAGSRWLRVTGPFEHFVKEVNFDPAATDPILLELQAGCRFRGNLRSRWTQWPDTTLILCAQGARPGHSYADRPSHYYTLELAEDGSFDLAGIRPGTYDLLLDYDPRAPFPGEGGMRMSPSPIGAPLAAFTLQPGLDQPWSLEYPDREPGAVALTVTLDGTPPTDCALGFWRQDEWSGSFVNGLPLAADGRMTTDWLTPGSTRVLLQRIEAGSGRILRTWTSAVELPVRSGETLTQSVDFVDRRIRLRLLDRDGVTPLAGLEVAAEGRLTDYGLRSDADGWYELDWVPQSPVRIGISGAGVDVWTAELSWAPEELAVTRTLIRP